MHFGFWRSDGVISGGLGSSWGLVCGDVFLPWGFVAWFVFPWWDVVVGLCDLVGMRIGGLNCWL